MFMGWRDRSVGVPGTKAWRIPPGFVLDDGLGGKPQPWFQKMIFLSTVQGCLVLAFGLTSPGGLLPLYDHYKVQLLFFSFFPW